MARSQEFFIQQVTKPVETMDANISNNHSNLNQYLHSNNVKKENDQQQACNCNICQTFDELDNVLKTSVLEELNLWATNAPNICETENLEEFNEITSKTKVSGESILKVSPVSKDSGLNYKTSLINEKTPFKEFIRTNSLEDSIEKVKKVLQKGCVPNHKCYKDLDPEQVFKHRLYLSKLSKQERDGYFMGKILNSIEDCAPRMKHNKRRTIRMKHVYWGRLVCVNAFLYLENCTYYYMKQIKSHVLTSGVKSRLYKCGKITNSFESASFELASAFIKQYLQISAEDDIYLMNDNRVIAVNSSYRQLYFAYKENLRIIEPEKTAMSYTTFLRFIQIRFSYVAFIFPDRIDIQQSNQETDE